MKRNRNLHEKYKPFNFSTTRCVVIQLLVSNYRTLKIDQKLPLQMDRLKGIYVTTNILRSREKVVGLLSLSFNDGALKCLQMPVFNFNAGKIITIPDTAPLAFDEGIKNNSRVQGYYMEKAPVNISYTVTIYLHYSTIPQNEKNPVR